MIPLAAQVRIGAIKVTRLFKVIPFQVPRHIAIYGDPAPGDQKYRYLQ